MTGGYQPLGQQRREQLPRPVVTRGRPPRDRRQHGDSDRAACLAVNGNAFRLPVPNLAPHRFTQLGSAASLIMLFALHPRLGKGTTTAPLYTRVLTQKVRLEIVVLSCGLVELGDSNTSPCGPKIRSEMRRHVGTYDAKTREAC